MNTKFPYLMVMCVVGLLMASAIAFADVNINSVKVNGDQFTADEINTLNIERGEEVEIRVTVTSNQSLEDVQVSAYLRGSDGDLIEDVSDAFEMEPGVSYVKKLMLNLPKKIEQKKYTLNIRVEDNLNEKAAELDFSLQVEAPEHSIQIKDIVLSPENNVKAGRALIATARIKNVGSTDEDDIKVKVSIPELGLSASDYIDTLDAECGDNADEDCDDSTTSEELYVEIPKCAEVGEYTVKLCAEFNDGDDEECLEKTIDIVEGDLCGGSSATTEEPKTEAKTVITIGPDKQDVEAGKSAPYTVTLSNQGTESKSYSIGADGGNWAVITMTPSNMVVLGPGESKSIFVNVAPSAAASAGEQMFSVTINSGEKVLKQVPLKATVTKAAKTGDLTNIKRGLEIGFVVLVLLLVILGLIWGFSKLKGSEEETKEEQTYY